MIKCEKGVLQIPMDELVERLDHKARRDLARTLVADEHLFKAVLEYVADPSKYAGHYFKDDEDGEWWFSHQTVLEMREKLIPMMPEIARLATEEALRQRDEIALSLRVAEQWAWKLWHAWPGANWQSRPQSPERAYMDRCKLCGVKSAIAVTASKVLLCRDHHRSWILFCSASQSAEAVEEFLWYMTQEPTDGWKMKTIEAVKPKKEGS